MAEHRQGHNPYSTYGHVLKDSRQGKLYPHEDMVPEFSSSDEDGNFDNLTPRSSEIYAVTKDIKRSFKDSDKPPKTKVTFYKIGKIIGKGAFGKVNVAMHILSRKLVAIKSIKKEHTRTPDSKTKLMREVNILATLNDRLFIKLYDFFDDEKNTYLVTTLCEGGNLSEYLRKCKWFDENICKYIFINIAHAIKILHENKIVHRDIKPENVLICRNGNLKM
jgi:serine/threonine protein kinase